MLCMLCLCVAFVSTQFLNPQVHSLKEAHLLLDSSVDEVVATKVAPANQDDSTQYSDFDQVSFNKTLEELRSRHNKLYTLKYKYNLHLYSGRGDDKQMAKFKSDEQQLVRDTVASYGLTHFVSDFEDLAKTHNSSHTQKIIFSKYGAVFDMLKDFYFEFSELLQDEADDFYRRHRGANRQNEDPAWTLTHDPFIQSFFYTYTAAILNHPRARVQYTTFFLQNGLLPNKALLSYALSGSKTDIRGQFSFLKYVSPDL